MLKNANGNLHTALHFIDNPSEGTVHSSYAVNACVNIAVMRFGTITRKGYGSPGLINANSGRMRKYWKKILEISLSTEEQIAFSEIQGKIDAIRDNALSHSNSEFLQATDMGHIAGVSIGGKIGWTREEIEFWCTCTDKIITGIYVVCDEIEKQETTKYKPFAVAGEMVRVNDSGESV